MTVEGPYNVNSTLRIPTGYDHDTYYKKAACYIYDRHSSVQDCSKMFTLLPLYFAYSELLGINPLIPICETLNENCFLTYPHGDDIVFPGREPNDSSNPNDPEALLDQSFKNTAGIKKSSEEIAKYIHEIVNGDTPQNEYTKQDCNRLDTLDSNGNSISDYEPGCHMRFSNWCESVMAQIQHIAHYSEMYTNRIFGDFDPRASEINNHNPNINIGTFLQSYSSTPYDGKLPRQMNEILDEPTFHGEIGCGCTNQDHESHTLDEKFNETQQFVDAECLADLNNIQEVLSMFGEYYVVRTSFSDRNSGPFNKYSFFNAVEIVNNNPTNNYKVFDMAGNQVYPCFDDTSRQDIATVIDDLHDLYELCN